MPVCPKCNSVFDDDLKFCSRDGSLLIPLATETYLPVGVVLNESLRVVERVRTDRLGVVYRVDDTIVASRSLALRLFRRGLVSSPVFAALGELAEAVGALSDEPGLLLGYIPVQLEDGRPALLCEDTHGQTLDSVIAREAPLTPTLVVRLLIRIAEILASAHSVGLVHGNVTPENVFLVDRTESGLTTRVADFGVASVLRTLNARALSTGELSLPGDYNRYFPPELVTGRGAAADARTDVFSIGALCYQMLSGWIPFSEGALESDSAVYLTEDPRPLVVLNKELGVPGELERLMLRALEHDPARRPQSIEELVAELQEVEMDLTINPPPSSPAKKPKAARRGARPGRKKAAAPAKPRAAGTDEVASPRATSPNGEAPPFELELDADEAPGDGPGRTTRE